MRVEHVRRGEPVVVGEVAITPIVRVLASAEPLGDAFICYGQKEPLGVLILTPEGERAFRASGEKVGVEELLSELRE
jgi:hypothetical protein